MAVKRARTESPPFKQQFIDDVKPTMTSASPPAKRLKFDKSASVTVHVGADKTAFLIHRGPICKASSYFNAVFDENSDSEFIETSQKHIDLPDYDPETFDEFLTYAYGKMLGTAYDSLGAEEQWMQYGKLFVLADYLGAPEFKNQIIRKLWQLLDSQRGDAKPSGLNAKGIEYIFDNTIRGSGIRKLIVAHFIHGKHEAFHQKDAIHDLDIKLTGLHEDFLAELAAEAMRQAWSKSTYDPFKHGATPYYDRAVVKKAAGKK